MRIDSNVFTGIRIHTYICILVIILLYVFDFGTDHLLLVKQLVGSVSFPEDYFSHSENSLIDYSYSYKVEAS